MKQIGRTVCYCKVDYSEIDELVKEVYGVKYNCVSDMKWSNDSQHRLNVTNLPLDPYDQGKLDDFMKGRSRGYMLDVLMNDMCNKNLIPAGKYLVDVCW